MAQSAALPTPEDDDSPDKMSFLEHLDELRRRIIFAAMSLGIGSMVVSRFTFIFIGPSPE